MNKVLTHNRILRKALTKPIWWYETSRSYPTRERAFSLPPLPTNSDPSTVLLVLTTPKTIQDAVWAAQSMIRHLPDGIGLLLVVDGNLKPTEEAAVRIVFPNVILEQTSTPCDALRPIAPNVIELGKRHPMGRKLAAVLQAQRQYDVVFIDADVLGFGEMPELCRSIADRGPALYIQDVGSVCVDPVLLKHIATKSYQYADTLNAGLLYIPRESLPITVAEELLIAVEYDLNCWFLDTTILAVLMQRADAQPLPRSQYVVSCERQFYFESDVDYDKIAVRHFVSPVRHLMYSRGMPKLFQQWTSLSGKNDAH